VRGAGDQALSNAGCGRPLAAAYDVLARSLKVASKMTTSAKGLGHGPARGPQEDMLPGWRAACLAYRREWRAGSRDGGAMYRAAVDAFREAVPKVSLEVAREQTTRAIHWASVYHATWLWEREG
jgi:hypothetical protein